ncbi:hepatocyte growth factor activator-like, partial [Clarias magur]
THGEEIINGRKAKKNSLQYMTSVQSNGKHICGGFLISPKFVLTAAHCNISDLSVVIGSQNIDSKKSNLKKYAVKSKHPHPSYKNPRFGFDIMLLKLSQQVKLDKHVKTCKTSSKSKPIKPNTKCQVAGWGSTENQKIVNDLFVADVSTINMTVCKNQWNKKKVKLPDNVLCAGGYGTKSGACQ